MKKKSLIISILTCILTLQSGAVFAYTISRPNSNQQSQINTAKTQSSSLINNQLALLLSAKDQIRAIISSGLRS